MCGIAGFTGQRPRPEATLRAMSAAIAHRGPDDAGHHLTDAVGLAIRRLSIIDVEHGKQPYRSERGNVIAVFNGEIYGFAGLRERLERAGHRFNSDADGEVLVHAYEEYGERFVEHIDGMFALAVWDEERRMLVLARDRLGKKPLYLARHSDGTLTFASEVQSLLQDPKVRADADPAGIARFLQFGYIPASESALKGVTKLRPGWVLTWSPHRIEQRPYWSFSYEPKLDIRYEDAVEEFDQRVAKSVRARLISDVPLGAFLSGGLDSSLVVAHMVQASARVKTFSMGFADQRFDERPYAARIAERLGTEHTEDVVTPDDLVSVVAQLARHFGEPYADSSAVPMFYLARMARSQITVALCGDGGDELFAGYDRHLAARLAAPFDRLPNWARVRLALAGARLIGPAAEEKSHRQRAYRFFRSLRLPAGERFCDWSSMLTLDERSRLAPAAPRLPAPATDRKATHPVDRALATDITYYLPDDILAKTDIATMASSLEARAPLLDYRLVEWVARLPVSFKQRGLAKKRLIASALGRHLPPELFERPKMGFAVPLAGWMRGELREFTTDLLLDPRSTDRGWIDRGALEGALRQHLEGTADHSRILWTFLMLELWYREVLERGGSKPHVGAGSVLPG